MSFNVLAFGDPAANKRVLRGANNEILPVDYSLVSALNTDVTRSMLGDGLDAANAIRTLDSSLQASSSARASFIGGFSRGTGEAGSAHSYKRGPGLGFGRTGVANGGAGSKLPVLASNGTAIIGFDTIALTGQDPNRNVFAVRASDISHVSRLALHIPATANAVINVMGMARPTGMFPSIVGAASENILVNFVSADNSSTSGSTATGSGQTGLGFAASALAGTNPNSAQDPLGAFGSVSGGSAAGVFGSGGAGQIAAGTGNGGIRPAVSPPITVNSVLPENSGLLLLSFGLLGLLPLMRRRR